MWKQIYPGGDFTYNFFDDSIALLYEKDYKTATLLSTAMFIAIFISCLGLFGLSMFAAGKRTKEIGIRKVLGASIANILIMLSKDFIALVIISITIASPITWYFMNNWLQDFVYRIKISWWMFAAAGLMVILIVIISVSYQVVKAATANPVKTLRYE